jgi:hypothetical protein
MRFLMVVTVPHEQFNARVKDASAGKIMQDILGEIKPEAAYLTEMNGKRTFVFVVNLNEPSEMPKYAEPFFLKFNADVEWHPTMLPEDLAKAGLEGLGKKWG